jgi:sulfur carrier protein ThiS
MNSLTVGKDTIWHKGMKITDLLIELKETRPVVGVLINGIYVSRSNFDKTKVPDKAHVEFILWREGMSLRELVSYHKEEGYVCAATIDGLLIPENNFDQTTIPRDAVVEFITFVEGG